MLRSLSLLAALAALSVQVQAIETTDLQVQSATVGGEDSAIAEAQPDPELLQAENIVRISGLTGLSEQARNIAQQVLNEQAAPIGQQFDVVDRLASQWAPTVLQQNLISVLTAKLNKTQRDRLEQTLDSNTLKDGRSKELQAIAQQSGPAYNSYIQRLRANPVGGARLELIRKLDQAMQFSALLKATREQVYPQLEAVISDWKPPQDWQAGLEQDVLEFLFYVHRSTPNNDLERIIQLYTRPEMQLWLSGVRKQLAAG